MFISIFYVLIGGWVMSANLAIFSDQHYWSSFEGIENHKSLLSFINGLLLFIGGVLIFKSLKPAIWCLLIGLSVFIFSATFDVIGEHGMQFYTRMFGVFYGIIVMHLVLIYSLYRLVKHQKNLNMS